MENVVSIRLEDFLEIRDRVLELEQELDNAHNEVQELNDKVLEVKGKNFELKFQILKAMDFVSCLTNSSLEEFSNIKNVYSWSLDKLHTMGFTDNEITNYLALYYKEEKQKGKKETEC